MKKLICAIFIVSIFSFGALYCAGLADPKEYACKQACQTALDKCKESAAGNEVKTAACEVGYNECVDKCN